MTVRTMNGNGFFSYSRSLVPKHFTKCGGTRGIVALGRVVELAIQFLPSQIYFHFTHFPPNSRDNFTNNKGSSRRNAVNHSETFIFHNRVLFYVQAVNEKAPSDFFFIDSSKLYY